MKLTEQELEIFKAARAMYDEPWWGYICVSLGRAGQQSLPDDHSVNAALQMTNITESLGDGIVAAMRGLYTMDKWVHEETGYRTANTHFAWHELSPKKPVKVIPTALFQGYMVMARMAWLDKIIETGEIN